MDGLMQQQQAQPTPPAQQPAQQPNAKQQMLPKVLAAAQKLMYSEKTRPMFMRLLEGDGDKIDIASSAAVKVILTIVDETKGRIDGDVVPPAGVAIVGDVLDFMEKSEDIQFTADDTHKAVAMFLEKLQAAIAKGGDSMMKIPQPEMQ